MTLYLKILQMMHHPVKRIPLPYIYGSINFPLNQDSVITEKSNAVPPSWYQNTFKFNLPDSIFEEYGDDDQKILRIEMIESRLFMEEERLGFCDIFIPSLPRNKILIQWAVLTSYRPYLPKMMCLLMLQLNTDDSVSPSFDDDGIQNLDANLLDEAVFNAPLATPDDILLFEPWDPREIELKYLNQIGIKNLLFPEMKVEDELNNDENENIEQNEEEQQYQSPLKSVLKMFSEL